MSQSDCLINGSQELVSPLDRGFAYGDGVFRTLKVHHGKPVAWQLHYEKLVHDARALGIVCPDEALFLADIARLFSKTEGDAVAKLIVTRGVGDRGYALPRIAQPLRVVIKAPFPQYTVQQFSEGVQLFPCQTRLGHQPRLAGIKHLNRLENVLGRMEWSDSAFFDGLMLDTQSNVIECTAANIFIRTGQTLMTPRLNECGVAGVTRQMMMELGGALELQVIEETLSLSSVLKADEVLICNSLYGALQVTRLGETTWAPQGLAERSRTLLKHAYAFI